MAKGEVNRLLRDLDVSFDAALVNAEEAAADELAYSLLQGLDLPGAIRRWGSGSLLLLASGATVPIEEVGVDYVAGVGGVLVPGERALIARSEGPPPSYSVITLIARLRRLARAGRTVAIAVVGGREFEGALVHVRGDHLELTTRSTSVLVPSATIVEIRTSGGG